MFGGLALEHRRQVAPVRVDAPPEPRRDQDERRRLRHLLELRQRAAPARGSSARPGGCSARPSRASGRRRRARSARPSARRTSPVPDGPDAQAQEVVVGRRLERDALRQDREAETLGERGERPPGRAAGRRRPARRQACTGPRASARGSRRSAAGRPARAGLRPRSTCVAMLRHVAVLDVRDDHDGRPSERRLHARRVRERRQEVAAEHEERLQVARLHLVEHRDRRVLAALARQLRAARRARLGLRVGGARPLVEPLHEAGVEPDAARPLQRPGHGEQRDREPLRQVRGRRHRGARARLQREAPVPPHGGEQRGQVLGGQAREIGRSLQVEALDGRAQLVHPRRVRGQVLAVGAVAQQLPDEEGQQGVVGAGAQRQVPRRELRRLGAAGVDDPHLAAPRELADPRRRVREGLHVGVVGDDGVRAEEQGHRRPLEVDAVEEPAHSRHQAPHDRVRGRVDRARGELRRGAEALEEPRPGPVEVRVEDGRRPEVRARPRPGRSRRGPPAPSARGRRVAPPTTPARAGRSGAGAARRAAADGGGARRAPGPWGRCTPARRGGRDRPAPRRRGRRRA